MSHDPYVVTIDYTNWRGERSLRRIKPRQPDGVRYGTTKWHKECQWLLRAIDVEKGEEREFAMKDIHHWGKEGLAQTGAGLAEEWAALCPAASEKPTLKDLISVTSFERARANWANEHRRTILAALRASEAHGEAVEALRPFANFAAKAEAFVERQAAAGKSVANDVSGIMPPTKDFRLSDFQRARSILAKLDASQGAEGG